jgi:sterol desaturase/sphingolipid hydroxylase (fatty acid hydroxylase superfamily)
VISVEILQWIGDALLYPVRQILMPESQIYWLYLLCSFFIAVIVYVVRFNRQEVQSSFLQYCFPKEVFLHESAILDYQNYLPIMLFKSLIVTPIATVISAKFIANFFTLSLVKFFGIVTVFPVTEVQLWHHFAFSLFLILTIDFGYYYNHYIRHKTSILWEFHKIHHTAEVLTPFTLFRHHPLDYLIQTLTVSLFSGLAIGIWTYLFGNQMEVLYLNGIPFVLFIFYITGNFRHAHIWLSFPYWVSHIFISPAQHYIHHANESKYYDANYGKIFAIWDWMFGTLYVPKTFEKLPLGLPNDEAKNFNTVGKFYLQPFRSLFQSPKNEKPIFSLSNLDNSTNE